MCVCHIQEERAQLRAYTGPWSELYEGEQFFMETLALTNLDHQIAVYKLMRDFEPQILVRVCTLYSHAATCAS